MAANVATTLADALKVFYLGGQNEQLNKKSILYSRFVKKSSLDVTGKSYTYLLHTGRNTNAGLGMSEGGNFGTAGNQGYKAVTIPNRYLSGALEITGPAIRAAKANVGAFVDGVKSEVDGLTNDFIRNLNRQLNGNGTGWLGYWTAVDDTSGTVIDDSQGNAFIHLDGAGVYTLDLIDTDNSTVNGNGIVVTVGAENANDWTVTWTGTVASSGDGDYLVYDGTINTEVMGIDGIISASDPGLPTGGLQGLAVATFGYWKAQSFGASGTKRDLSFELMQKPLTRIDTHSGANASDVPFLLANGPIYDKYCALCRADKRHVNTMRLDGGQTAVDFNGYPLVIDPQTKRNTIFYPNPKAMELLTSSDGITWADFLDGEQFKMKVGSSGHADAYNAYMVFYGNFACKQRNASGVLFDITD